jgi:spore coat protein H
MTRLGMLASFVCAMILIAPARSAGAAPQKEDAAESLFGPDKVYTLHLHLTEEDWQLMQPTRRPRAAPVVADSIPAPAAQPAKKPATTQAPLSGHHEKKAIPFSGEKLPPNNFGFEFVYVKAAVEWDGEKLDNVAVRFKGNASYDNFQRSLRRPLKIEFDRFEPGRKFRGIATLNLSNNAFDSSQLREALSYEVYRRAGVPAPRTAFAILYLSVDGRYDHTFVGFFTIIEEIDDKSFLKEHFGNTDGILLKPEGIRGLPYMGENWVAYPQRYHAKTHDADPKLAGRFIEFVKLVNYADDATFRKKIGEYLNVDDFMRYLAATVLIANLDSPLVTNHNFYLYENPADQKVWMLPWDMNLSFAGYGTVGPRDDQINLSISHPWGGQNKLFERVMAIDDYDKAYRKHLRTFVEEFFNSKTMNGVMDRMQIALREADKAAVAAKEPPVSWDMNGGGFGYMRHSLREFIPARVESVLAQLDHKDAATFVPRPNPIMVFNWGINAPPNFGTLPDIAQAIRKFGDHDGDFQISGREARDAAAVFYYLAADDEHPESVGVAELTAALTPLLAAHSNRERGQQQQQRGFLSFFRGNGGGGAGAGSEAATLWANAIVRDADTDRDGRVTLDELINLVDRLFCTADRDQNGTLDEREIIEALDELAAPNGVPDYGGGAKRIRR